MAKRLIIEGRVQGVGYRASFAAKASALGLAGWVRNRRDGSVEALVHGDEATIEVIVAWSQVGPPAARVNTVTIIEIEEVPASGNFGILPTC